MKFRTGLKIGNMAVERSRYVDIDWKSHRDTLDDVFFTDDDVIKRFDKSII